MLAEDNTYPGVVKTGGYVFEDGTKYIGDWNSKGQMHGLGILLLPNYTRYHGTFLANVCSGLGVMNFPDGAKYEGELMQGWFHGHGVFWRNDGTKYEGEFRGGRIWGLGLVTFSDGTHGFPRMEGYFQDCRFLRRKPCQDVVQRAQKISLLARAQVQFDKTQKEI
ncbi:MORN repeat-containing protein 4 homolog isoform X2 [Cimex lectularius]|uniref:MORN repeat-containing protein 4 homolog n=1 Tax=Cimex lectularius TaxID=79782 RepID=A0A8I6SMT4_CIMLE|nr:MORN repeat-containing protein 4 homolog isoform X2 [Cimex lectularius]